MKILHSCFALLALSFFINCEMKPVEDVYGLSPEETNQLIAGLIANQSLRDNGNGTISDPVANLVWQKCTHGQVFRAGFNDCLGAPQGSLFNPNDVNRAGAIQVAFCDSKTHACNSISYPQVIQGTSSISIAGSSELFAACQNSNFLGATWRVPTPLEYQRLVIPGRAATLQYFPSTQEEDYWTAWSNQDDLPGETAFAISFDRQSYGVERSVVKTQRNYVRCVRQGP
ncbi:PF07603 family protein [Leptospira yanagawae serovar Saopaulo str. Sao Paulo = ATCC 700523]|uniref:PF07603 family protein n=1 Tax=Leptospira yanagawae serovar Saopaulo str. Sao Paulo = ATCC 700523 TaxID=1249483 RepID=A0A5E8HD52_9LEPT|nr:DUF1566 domain-containing protein [Leptospira yanagawae]EOQ89205.1 PF07603 family protein [Leptospira yanagawae serovar Saopaulo str. Sao Paulo = ATCC 700523]